MSSIPIRPYSPPPPPAQTPQPTTPRSQLQNEVATLQHQLRQAKGTIHDLQTKLGERQSPAPFGSRSSRQGSLTPGAPLLGRRASAAELALNNSTSADLSSSTSSRPNGTPIPGSVSLNRSLVSDDGGLSTSPTRTRGDSAPFAGAPAPASAGAGAGADEFGLLPPPPPEGERTPSPSLGSGGRGRGSGSNPFFGGNGVERMKASERSAQSGSGKVISGLQSDLLVARQALEATRNQLRLSQRAVEFLTRGNDDLKETKERLSTEIEGLHKMLARKERNQEEVLGRARAAEAGLTTLQATHRTESSAAKAKVKELEQGYTQADEARKKAESEYSALAKGMKSMSEGFKADIAWLKADLQKSETRLEAKHSSLSKLKSSQTADDSVTSSSLERLEQAQREAHASFSATLQAAVRDAKAAARQGEEAEVEAAKVRLEYARFRRTIEESERGKEGGGG